MVAPNTSHCRPPFSTRSLSMHFSVLLIILLCSFSARGQVVYSVDYKYDADVKVYVSKYKSDADLVVFKTTYKSDADENKGVWYFTEYKSDADKKIYFCEYKSDADLVIYFSEYKSDAEWKDRSKMHLMY